MKTSRLLRPFAALLCAAAFAAPLAAQEEQAGSATVAASATGQAVLSSSELVTYFFSPRHAGLKDVYELARDLYGRTYYVVERGGYRGRPVENIQVLGDSIVIYDTQAIAQAVGEALHGLDAQIEAAGASSSATSVATVAWTPRHVALRAAWSAVERLQNETVHLGPSGSQRVVNLSLVPELSTIVIRDTPARVAELTAMLDALDRPEPQLLLTLRVVVGRDGQVEDGGKLPQDLVRDLASLVPYAAFEQIGYGVVRSSARADRIHLTIDETYNFDLRPAAFDEDTGRMTVELEFQGGVQAFSTRVTLGLDEDTVLGASGAEPVFAVVSVRRLDGQARGAGAGQGAR